MNFLTFHDAICPDCQIIIRSDKIVSFTESVDITISDQVISKIRIDDGTTYVVTESAEYFKKIINYNKTKYDNTTNNVSNSPLIDYESLTDDDTTTGMRLKLVIESANISFVDAASLLGIHPSTLSRYLNDKQIPSERVLMKFSKLFNVPLRYL